jgi:hypothetical protein
VGAKLQPIQMFGYWVNSVTVDEWTNKSQNSKIMIDSSANSQFRVADTQGVYKVTKCSLLAFVD